MKTIKKLLLGAFSLSALIFHGQTTIEIGEKYVFKVNTQMYEASVNGAITPHPTIAGDSIKILSPVGGRFQVVNETNQFYVIQFDEWTVEKKFKSSSSLHFTNQITKANLYNFVTPINNYNAGTKTLNNNAAAALPYATIKDNRLTLDPAMRANTNIKFFVVWKNNFNKKVVSMDEYSRWVATSGTLVFPFKLRPQTGDFSKDVTISGVVGAGYKVTKNHTINGILGLGLASVTLDSLNTEGKVLKASDRAAMSLSCGFVFQYKQIQLGAVLGWDILNRSTRDNWIYNEKPWISIGVGINIFKTDDNDEDTPKISND